MTTKPYDVKHQDANPDANKPENKQSTFAQEIANKLIAHIKEGTSPWQKPWQSLRFSPFSAATGNRYHGFNALKLMLENREDPRWLTYNQAKNLGAQVRKGEKGVALMKYIFDKEITLKDDNGNPVLDKDGKPQKETVPLDKPIPVRFVVFNASQVDGLPPFQRPDRNEWQSVERAECMVENSGATIVHGSTKAFYRPVSDEIHMPSKEAFSSPEGYYSTLLHELGHWTGHTSRLNRDFINAFGSPDYAREELRAEIASLMICQSLELAYDFNNHAAYVESWVKVLEETPEEIMKAARDAEKIHHFVMDFERNIIAENTATDVNQIEVEDHEPELVM